MLERSITQGASMAAPSDTRLIDLEHLVGILLRQSRIIAICVALGLLVGFVVLLLAPRSYHAASQIIIEGQMDELAPDLRSGPRQLDVEGQILNQMEVIGSSRLARIVAEAESLTTDAVFLNPPPTAMEAVRETVAGLLGQVTGNPRPQRETVTEAPMETVTGMLRAGVNVSRVGRSSVIWLCFESHDAELAYRIANAYATAFVQDQLNADLEVTREAADWLRERLTDLGTSQQQAALEVEQFRQESGLTMSADTDLTVRRLQLLTDQIGEASAKVADLQAVVSQLERVDTGDAEQVVSAVGLIAPESASNDAVASLREAYVRAERRIVEISGLYGEDHPQVVALRQEQRSVGLQLSGQLHALLNRYRSELRVAQSRVQELEAQVDAEGRAATETNQALIQLTALQQRSDALNVLYRSYLTRYEETIQAQSFPIPAARVISDASLPNAATGPRTIFTLAAALIFGGFLGLALSALNELRERSFRLGSQVTRETGLRFLGYMNALPGARTGDKAAQAGQVQQDIRRQIERRRANLPSTLLTETLKSIRVAAMARRVGNKGVVVGLVSALPGEGKTSIAIGLAELAAADGYITLLIDGDTRRAVATSLVAPEHKLGLDDIAQGKPWTTVLFRDPLGFDLVSAYSKEGSAGNDLSSPYMQKLLDEARDEYDFIIIDLPPIGAMVDAVSIHPWTDGLVLVTEWGKTPRRLVKAVIEREPQIAEDMIGVVLNRVQLNQLPRYSSPGDAERFVAQYPDYFRVSEEEKAGSAAS